MLAMAVLFLVTAALSFAAVVFFARRYEEALPLSVFAVILLLYGFGLAGLLKTGVYAVLALSLGAGLSALLVSLRRKALRAAANAFFTPAFLLFALFTAAVAFANAGRLVIEFDEYSHWALAVKAMALENVLAPAASVPIPFATYPPALSLLQYFAVSVQGSFSEGTLYMCSQFFGLALLMPVLRTANFRQFGKILLFALCLLLVPILFKANLYGSILADCLMGLVSGYAFSVVLLHKEKGAPEWASLCAALAVLVLIKDTGLFFAVAIAFALLLDTLRFSKRLGKSRALPLCCALAAPAAAKGAWMAFTALHGASDKFSGAPDLSALAGGGASAVVSGFMERLFATDEGICLLPLSTFQLLLLLTALVLVTGWRFACLSPAEGRRLRALLTLVFAAAAAFLCGVLLAYLVGFEAEESQYAPSFARYVSPALYTLLLPCLALWGEHLLARRDGAATLAAGCIALALLFCAPADKLAATFARYSVGNSRSIRAEYDAAADAVLSALPDAQAQGARIRVFSQTEDDLDRYALAYLLYPARVDGRWQYPAHALTDGALWEADAARLDYVYFYRADDALRRFFASRTGGSEPADGSLWRVRADGTLEKLC